MTSIIVLFSILLFLFLLFILLLLSNIQIEIVNYNYDSSIKQKIKNNYYIYFKLKLFNKLTWIKVKIDKKRMNKIKGSRFIKTILFSLLPSSKEYIDTNRFTKSPI